MKYFAILCVLLASLIASVKAQTNLPLNAFCAADEFTIQGDASFFTNWPNPIPAKFFFGLGDPRNGDHTSTRASAGPGSNILRVVFPNISCSGPNQTDLSFAMTLTTLAGVKKNYVFINGNYCPDCKSLQKCPTFLSCANAYITLKFDYNIACPTSGVDPNIRFNFGSGHPFNDFVPSSIACVPGPPGELKLGKTLSCYGGCPDISKLKSITVDGAVCLYENGQLITEPTCSPNAPYNSGSTPSVCNAFFNNCLDEFNHFLFDNRSELSCRQWKQQVARCDPDLWAGRLGKIGIGAVKSTGYAMTVKDGIITDRIRVQTCSTGGWCDYVFDPSYRLMPLNLLKEYIVAHRHLPGTPSAAQIEKAEGFLVKDVIMNHQEKIEEIFLHLIALKKEADLLQGEYERLAIENMQLRK